MVSTNMNIRVKEIVQRVARRVGVQGSGPGTPGEEDIDRLEAFEV